MVQSNLYTFSVQPMIKGLKTLSILIDKGIAHAETKASERLPTSKQMEALLNDRIIFDQFTLMRQVQIATDNAKGGAGRLAEVEIPKFEDNEMTVEELKSRLDKTIKFLETIKPEQVNGKEDLKIVLPFSPTKYLTGLEYVSQHLMPNFYFHMVTAYSILRKNGVNVGKIDFLNELPLKDL